jgi:AcrR family transcriptional regulator
MQSWTGLDAFGKTPLICVKEGAIMFGKRGRPPEDQLARQREIYEAVAPLLLRDGARRLSMREAAEAACLSIGGLYHYFPSKRDLVLHGLYPEALFRLCQDFHAEFGYLTYLDPLRYAHEGIEVVVKQVGFCRPAIHAALELGSESFWEVIENLLTGTALDFEMHLQQAAPDVSEQELHRCGRAIRRSICAALLDKSITSDELRDELRVLVAGYMSLRDRAGLALGNVTIRRSAAVVTD